MLFPLPDGLSIFQDGHRIKDKFGPTSTTIVSINAGEFSFRQTDLFFDIE